MRSKIGPMKRVARMLRGHRPLILNWFRAKGQLSSGVVEGFNAKAEITTRKAYGFRPAGTSGPPVPGQHHLTLFDPNGQIVDSVIFEVRGRR